MGNNMSLMAAYSYLFQTWVSKAVSDFFAQSSTGKDFRVAFSVKVEVFNCSPTHRRMCTQVFYPGDYKAHHITLCGAQ